MRGVFWGFSELSEASPWLMEFTGEGSGESRGLLPKSALLLPKSALLLSENGQLSAAYGQLAPNCCSVGLPRRASAGEPRGY